MEKLMNLYITFFTIFGQNLYLNNGFSFGVEKEKDDEFLFFSSLTTTKKIHDEIQKYNPDKIFCSLTFFKHLDLIKPLINEKWVLGGPLVGRSYFSELLEENSATIFYGPMEHYLNKEISGEFFPYFEDFIRHTFLRSYRIMYNVSVGFGCYWGKCKFCSYKEFTGWCENKVKERPNIEKIFDDLPVFERDSFNLKFEVVAHTCIDSLTPKILGKLLSSKKTVNFMSFIRADKVMLEVVKKHSNLSNQLFSIGMEGFCQHIIDELGKGVQIDTAVELIDSITERKGKVSLTLMEGYPFLTENDVKESLSTIDRIKSIKEKGRLIYINSNGPVWWPGAKVASEYGFPIEKWYGEWYHCLLPTDSEQYKYNKQIIDYVRESGIPFVRGVRL